MDSTDPSKDFKIQLFYSNFKPYRQEKLSIPKSKKANVFHQHSKKPYASALRNLYDRRLLDAVNVNNVDRVRMLLEKGVSPNQTDMIKRSVLHLATTKNYVDIVRLLLEHGADPNIVDSIGNTPLHLASCTRRLTIITLLIKHGANLLATDRNGLNPLAIAYSMLKHCAKRRVLNAAFMTSEELAAYHSEVREIYQTILFNFQRQKHEQEYKDLKQMEERFEGLATKEEIDNQVDSLLATMESLKM